MRPRWLVGLGGALCAAIMLFLPIVTFAETATVTIGVGDTILQVSGKTSPAAFVTISKDGGVIGTAVADSSGVYSQTFTAQEPGLHELSIYAQTTSGQNTDTVSVNVNITEHATTSVSIFLPSTLTIQDASLAYGEQLILNGETAPLSTVTVYIDNSTYATTTTDAQGKWTISLATTSLSSGQHEVFVRVTDGFGEQSYPTAARPFTLSAQPDSSAPSAPGIIVPGGAPSVPVITFPPPDTVWHEPTITIRGTSGGRVQIELWDGDDIIGSVWSNNRGEWSMFLQLDPKEYNLRARACLEQRCSGFSATVRFRYEPSGPLSPSERPLRISVPQACFSVYQHQMVPLKAFVLEGQPPYKASIQWGDGTSAVHTFLHGDLLFPRSYAKPGKYTVTVDIRDAQGREKRIYFSVHVKRSQSELSPIIILCILLLIAVLCLLLYRKRTKN